MSIRYIQAAVTAENHKKFVVFACEHDMTLSKLVETAVLEYIERKRKEEKDAEALKETGS
jgi:hypothetical protein